MSQLLSNEEQILAAGYVLGDLDADEEAQVVQLLKANPAMQEEVDALRISLQLVPHALDKIAPPPQLEGKILAAHTASEISKTDRSSRASVSRSVPWSRLIAILSIPALLLLAFDNLRLRRQFSLAQQNVPEESEAEEVASILQRPKSRLVALQGEGSAGTLLFTPGQWEQVVVSIADLPPLPPEQVYRMWLSLDNGQPFLCGEFATDETGSVFVTLNPPEGIPEGVKAQEAFVTVAEGSAPLQPTGDRIVVGQI